jgi:hypothetical protein
VKESVKQDGEIDEDTDWEIERLVMQLYGMTGDQQSRVMNELKKVQQMRIVREMFPDWVEDDEDEANDS